MRYFAFILCLFISLSLAVALVLPIGPLPPLIHVLDPQNGFWANSFSEDMILEEELQLPGLEAPVQVYYDEAWVPHLYAENERDLMRAQGYVTAQHRLWQMEFQTMAAAGRVSELVGDVAIDVDRMTRRKGLPFAAENGLEFLMREDPDTYALVEAFSDGVNAYIEGLSPARLPVEYKLLNYRPEPWSPLKSMLLLKYMADMLVGDNDLQFSNLLSYLGKDLVDALYPDFPSFQDPVIEAEKVWNFKALPLPEAPDNFLPDGAAGLSAFLPNPELGVGSNNWAVSGALTADGRPILANDPHLGLNLPSIWFAMQLSCPAYTVKGATLPGALGIISGFNRDVAWGVTNATRDARDWYRITFKDASRTEYKYNEQWIQSTLRIEEIKVKGQSPLLDTVVYTHHGPVVYDASFRAERKDVNYALKWTAHDPSNEQRTFLMLNRAKNHEDYLEALSHYTSPAQNFVFASASGDIAMKVQGKFPLKWPEQGKYFLDGNLPAHEWQGYIPNAHHAATKNPKRGFVSSANQHPVADSYPYYVFDYSYEHYRNRRLNERLAAMNRITIKDMKALQFDNYMLHAAEAVPALLLRLGDVSAYTAKEQEVIAKLSDWNFYTHPNQEEPSYFDLWWKLVKEGMWEPLRQQPGMLLPNNFETTRRLQEGLEEEVLARFPELAAAPLNALIRDRFQRTVAHMDSLKQEGEKINWADYKRTSILHLVPNFVSFSHQNIYTGGGRGILNATSERHGASWRMVVAMGEEIEAYGIYPGGQSGNPGSKFYDNWIHPWSLGEYHPMPLYPKEEAEALFTHSRLVP